MILFLQAKFVYPIAIPLHIAPSGKPNYFQSSVFQTPNIRARQWSKGSSPALTKWEGAQHATRVSPLGSHVFAVSGENWVISTDL